MSSDADSSLEVSGVFWVEMLKNAYTVCIHIQELLPKSQAINHLNHSLYWGAD